MSLSEEIQMITPPHLIFVLSILTNDLTQRSTDVFLLPIISSRRIRHQKDSSSDVMPILYCPAVQKRYKMTSPITANIVHAHSILKFEWSSYYLCVLADISSADES